ncbi:hypothetical protein [Prosthecomicrobium sp. N25]|uniref:hypothetical protein n=1 Tax=Prosthecomicrobium sp. N25 TaxID=3129254 RepID=UPI00307799F6
MPDPTIEFRIPISPTPGFFAQVRLFDFALRRLGGPYRTARILVVVGDGCDLEDVRRRNPWAEGRPIDWTRVPDTVFERDGYWGTANWRYVPEADADIVVLSDADTVLLGPVHQALAPLATTRPALAGHMAHYWPPIVSDILPPGRSPDFWPKLFDLCGAPLPARLHPYSCNDDDGGPLAPVYLNLGFVALNRPALDVFRRSAFDLHGRLKTLLKSDMWCQIAVPVLASRHLMHATLLPAEYNAANDDIHIARHGIEPSSLRVLHYLREAEFVRSEFLLPGRIDDFLARRLDNPLNRLLQSVVRDFRRNLAPTEYGPCPD